MFAENVATKLVGLIASVAVIAAIGVFIVKPILDTTNRAFDQFGGLNDTVQSAFDQVGIQDISVDDLRKINVPAVKRQLRNASLSPKERRKAGRLLTCIERVQPNTDAMQTCVKRFG